MRSNYTKHGLSNHPLYHRWEKMKGRCCSPHNTHYKYYGGRGITICNEWLDFINFYNDMYQGFEEYLTLDRIDNDGNYCKENCRWATRKEQARNTRQNVNIAYGEVTMCETAWARQLGMSLCTISKRIKRGWSEEQALTMPPNDTCVNITHNGVTMCLSEWSRCLGNSGKIVSERLKLGWSVEKAVTTPVRKYKKRVINESN